MSGDRSVSSLRFMVFALMFCQGMNLWTQECNRQINRTQNEMIAMLQSRPAARAQEPAELPILTPAARAEVGVTPAPLVTPAMLWQAVGPINDAEPETEWVWPDIPGMTFERANCLHCEVRKCPVADGIECQCQVCSCPNCEWRVEQ